MTISETLEQDKSILSVSGHIDTVTASDAQKAILLAFQKSNNVVLDLSAVDYISSAGLRALLIGQKTANSKHGSFVIRGANAELRKLIVMVGFDKILTMEQ